MERRKVRVFCVLLLVAGCLSFLPDKGAIDRGPSPWSMRDRDLRQNYLSSFGISKADLTAVGRFSFGCRFDAFSNLPVDVIAAASSTFWPTAHSIWWLWPCRPVRWSANRMPLHLHTAHWHGLIHMKEVRFLVSIKR